jgi:hypothetical protein
MSITKKDFYDRFIALLDNVRDTYELNNIHDALIVWYGENVLFLDPVDAKERVVTDNCAEGVDSILVDEESYHLKFVQCKTVASFNKTKDNYSENDIKSTLAGVRYLLKGDYKEHITPKMENLVDEYHELDKTGNYITSVTFIALKDLPVDDKFMTAFKGEFPDIKIDFLGFDWFYKFYTEEYLLKTARPPKKISFSVLSTLLRKELPIKSFVFVAKAEELARIYNDYKERIFQSNIRFSLGMRFKSINQQIFETARGDKSDKFWYFNNGITIVCDELTATNSEKVVNFKNAQVINGAQTTYAVYEAYQRGELKEDADILVKAIESTDRHFNDLITLYTNSQNAIRLRDLLSNLQIQGAVQKILLDTYKYFYERKRGEFESLYPTAEAKKKLLGDKYKDKIVSNENAAQAFLALYLNKPAEAKSKKAKIFLKDGGFYDTVFNEKDALLAEKLLLSWKMLRYIERKKKKFNKYYTSTLRKLGKKEEGKLTSEEVEIIADIYNFDFLFHSEYSMTSLFRDFLLNAGYDVHSSKDAIEEVMGLIDGNDKVIEQMYNDIKAAFAEHISKLRKNPGYYHNKYFKSEKSIALIREHFSEEFDFVDMLEKPR